MTPEQSHLVSGSRFSLEKEGDGREGRRVLGRTSLRRAAFLEQEERGNCERAWALVMYQAWSCLCWLLRGWSQQELSIGDLTLPLVPQQGPAHAQGCRLSRQRA